MPDKKIDMESEEYKQQLNSYMEWTQSFIQSFTSDILNKGVVNDVETEDLQKYLMSPDENAGILSDIAEYFYITTGEIHMMFELLESLPTLNYKVSVFDKKDGYERHTATIHKILRKIKYKTLTRDVLKQTGVKGTLTGIWLGEKNNLYPYIFDDPTLVFPAYRKNGDWVILLDMSMLDEFSEYQREIFFENLSPYVTGDKYNAYKSGDSQEKRYVALPQDRTFAMHTHKLNRNDSLGTGWANPAMFDIVHKKKMKNVERAIANKIINAIAVLTIGSERNPEEFGNIKLSSGMKRSIHSSVKGALERNASEGVSVVAVPEFAKLDFPDVKADGLDGKKFEHLNSDIQSSVGLSGAITHGDGGSISGAKINFDFFYKRVAVLLEQIEMDMYQKMVNLILPKSESDNFYIEFDKAQPLSTKERLDMLKSLNDKGWSTKHLVEGLDGVNWDEYLEQTLYETEDLKLQDKIKPYKSSHTISANDRDSDVEPEGDLTDEGIKTRDGDKNEL